MRGHARDQFRYHLGVYGLVNKAIRDLICTAHGEQVWLEIVASAGLELDSFVSMDTYEDQISYALVGAASERLGLEPAQVLEAFGEYWTKFTVREGYGDLIERSGESVEEFLDNLDNMHARVELSFPELRPPSFRLERLPEGELVLHYMSTREGLAPMVVGLLRGLGEHFDEQVEVEHLSERAQPGHEQFRVRVSRRPARSVVA